VNSKPEYGCIAAIGCPAVSRKHEETEIIPMIDCYTLAAAIKLILRIAKLLSELQNSIRFRVLGTKGFYSRLVRVL
jgi:hypothetical protein